MNDRVTGAGAELAGEDLKALKQLSESYQVVRKELSKVIIGQEEVIEQLMIAIFAQGHCLLEGVPGLAKTCLLYTSPSPRDRTRSRMPSSA